MKQKNATAAIAAPLALAAAPEKHRALSACAIPDTLELVDSIGKCHSGIANFMRTAMSGEIVWLGELFDRYAKGDGMTIEEAATRMIEERL